jgi:hypothetical protein
MVASWCWCSFCRVFGRNLLVLGLMIVMLDVFVRIEKTVCYSVPTNADISTNSNNQMFKKKDFFDW